MYSIKVECNVSNLKLLQNEIKKIDKIIELNKSKDFNSFLKDKVWQTLQSVMNKRLTGGTTNDNEINLYRRSNYIEDITDGFILYNNARIPADKYNILPFDTSGYENGEFSIALAFEYGTGIYGNASLKVIKRTKNRDGESWDLPKNVYGKSSILFSGYKGFEIYRNVEIEVNKNIKSWYDEYLSKEV